MLDHHTDDAWKRTEVAKIWRLGKNSHAMVYHQIPRVQCCNVPKALQNTDFKSASLTNQDWVVEFRAAVLILCSVIFAAATWALFEIREGQSPRRLDWFKWMHFWCSSAQVCFLLVPYVCLYFIFVYISVYIYIYILILHHMTLYIIIYTCLHKS